MSKCEYLSMGRYAWGNVYTVLSGCLGMVSPVPAALLMLGYVVYFGYLGSMGSNGTSGSGIENVAYILPALIAVNINLLPCPTLLVPAGRREKFYGMLAAAVALTLLGLVSLVVLTGVSVLLQGRLPQINFGKLVLDYHALDIRGIVFFVMFIPLGFLVNVLFRRNAIIRLVIMIGMMQVLIIGGVVMKLTEIAVGPVWVLVLTPLFWAGFLWVLDYHCRKRRLV